MLLLIENKNYYSEDFEGTINNEWNNTNTFNFNNTEVLGSFANESINLSLFNLPTHTTVQIKFDLYIHDTWDGDEIWNLKLNNSTIINTSFANPTQNGTSYFGSTQSYPDNIPAINPPISGAYNSTLPWICNSDNNTNSSVLYKINKSINSSSSDIIFEFSANSLQNLCDESWSIDNIQILINESPNYTYNWY